MARLRGHHLFCLTFFRGYGYGKDFVENVSRLLEALRSGEVVEIVEDVDDVCAFCPYNIDGVCRYLGNDLARVDRYALEVLGFAVGDRTGYGDAVSRVCREYLRWRHSVCLSCSWRYVCDLVYKSIQC